MKIICIGKNYAAHAKEMKSELPSEPLFFMKPDTALIIRNQPFFLPDFSEEIHHEVELVIKINKVGKNIEEKFAHKYYQEIGIGIDFTARDLQAKCKEKGHPWEIAKAFDGSAPLGDFVNKEKLPKVNNIGFHLNINGKTVQEGNTRDLLFSFDQIISYVSRFITLKKGDLIFTGTPEGVGPVHTNDRLEAFIGEEKLLELQVK
jgi:acylpyruvate hydrolase